MLNTTLSTHKIHEYFEIASSFPLININENFSNYLSPILSLRVNPSDMKSYKNENRKISNDNFLILIDLV